MSESLFNDLEIQVVIAALLHFGAFCGARPGNDVTSHSDGWQCEAILRKLNPYAADELAAKLVPRIDTRYKAGQIGHILSAFPSPEDTGTEQKP